MTSTTGTDRALARLLKVLAARAYHFVTPTPATHARVVAQRDGGFDLRDAIGWSLPFATDAIPRDIFDLLVAADVLRADGDRWRATLRVSSLGDRLFLHSAYPTDAADAVFFGPDSYRFAAFIAREAETRRRILDIGAGSGVGGIVAVDTAGAALTLADPNPAALRFAALNASAAGLVPRLVETAGADGIDGMFDLVVTNPPYMRDDDGPAYRSGGGMHGGALTVTLAEAGLARLAAGGRMLVYSGSAIINGEDRLRAALIETASRFDCRLRYTEIDPDVFGEELETPAYAGIERIAVIGAVFDRA